MRQGLLSRTGTVVAAVTAALAVGVAPAGAQAPESEAPQGKALGQGPLVMIYTGTTGYRHADAINNGRPVIQKALEREGYRVDWEDCDNNGGKPSNCDHPSKNPRIFTKKNLKRYSALLFFNASDSWAGGNRFGPLFDEAQRAAIIRFVQKGGGIAANHNATDMGAGRVSWDWWDGGPHSVVGSLMKGHAASSITNVADVHVEDPNHLSTIMLPALYRFGDEHYNFVRSVRDTHHVLLTLDESTYNPGGNRMGADHPITWCKRYNGKDVLDGTGEPKRYHDGRTWVTGMGHFGASYTANGGDNELVRQLVGGVRWVAGEGGANDCDA